MFAHFSECGNRYYDVRVEILSPAFDISTDFISLFAYGLNTGGPGVMTVGWIIVSIFSMAFILSCHQSTDKLKHSSSAPAWPRFSLQYPPLEVHTFGPTCSLLSNMRPSLLGSLAGMKPHPQVFCISIIDAKRTGAICWGRWPSPQR